MTLLLRCVWSSFAWNLPRWPYQKTIAVEMDSLQAKMIATIINFSKKPCLSLHEWWCQRHRLARQVAARLGLWSIAWAKRICDWRDHVGRSGGYAPIMHGLLDLRGRDWLLARRAAWVPSEGSGDSRLSLRAGRTGTRAQGGRPQPRWDEGSQLAEVVLKSRDESNRGGAKLSISTRIVEAAKHIRAVLYKS